MGIIDAFYEWCDKKIESIGEDEKHPFAKSFGYGCLRGIPEGLAAVGIMTLTAETINLLTGKGWRV